MKRLQIKVHKIYLIFFGWMHTGFGYKRESIGHDVGETLIPIDLLTVGPVGREV